MNSTEQCKIMDFLYNTMTHILVHGENLTISNVIDLISDTTINVVEMLPESEQVQELFELAEVYVDSANEEKVGKEKEE